MNADELRAMFEVNEVKALIEHTLKQKALSPSRGDQMAQIYGNVKETNVKDCASQVELILHQHRSEIRRATGDFFFPIGLLGLLFSGGLFLAVMEYERRQGRTRQQKQTANNMKIVAGFTGFVSLFLTFGGYVEF